MKRFTRATLLSTLLLLGATATAHAGDEWCSADPALPIKTPGGNTVVVHVTNYGLGRIHHVAVQQANTSYAVSAADNGGTNVTVTVFIRGDIFDPSFATRSVVSSGANATGTAYASTSGNAGTAMTMSFRLNVA